MVFCKVYCNNPPEEIDSCSRLKVQIVRMRTGSSKRVHIKMFPSCGSSSLYEPRVSKRNLILRPNMFVADIQTIPQRGSAEYYIVSNSGDVIQSGSKSVPSSGIFSIDIAPIENSGYYNVELEYFDGSTDSTCIFKLFVC